MMDDVRGKMLSEAKSASGGEDGRWVMGDGRWRLDVLRSLFNLSRTLDFGLMNIKTIKNTHITGTI